MSQTLSQILIPEFDREMARTRSVLAAVTKESMPFQPTESLHTISWNANHIASSIEWTSSILGEEEFDIAGPDGEVIQPPTHEDPAKVLEMFDEGVKSAREGLATASDQLLSEMWSLKSNGETIFTITKGDCIRTWIFNHMIHHRAILSVYLRMAGVEVTPVYDG